MEESKIPGSLWCYESKPTGCIFQSIFRVIILACGGVTRWLQQYIVGQAKVLDNKNLLEKIVFAAFDFSQILYGH